ncbi:MAG: GntR family transcriptional regulator, partial [Boseongicola sp. SB0662_bin_57]|nr:GntR family transcriptional regulator [Boseongicola sp. SB0662_bin_57]
MPGFPQLCRSSPKTCIIGIPFQAFSFAALRGRPWRNACPLGLATRLLGKRAHSGSGRPSRVRWHAAGNAPGEPGWKHRHKARDAFGLRRSFRRPSAHAWRPRSRPFRSGPFPDPDPVTKALADLASSPDVHLDLGIPISVNAHMESIDTELAARIRQDIILGSYSEGERLSEAQLCETHDVSRTPIRLALRLLEREGVIRRGEGRGYMVQSPTVEDILQAVEVRGHLE